MNDLQDTKANKSRRYFEANKETGVESRYSPLRFAPSQAFLHLMLYGSFYGSFN
jgi:hypothetical protein